MTRDPANLPKYARAYLRQTATLVAKQIVRQFHHWLLQHGIELQELDQSHIDKFLHKPWRKPVAPHTQNNYRLALERYLTDLYSQGHLAFCPAHIKRLEKARPDVTAFALPSYAQQYLRAGNTKSNSCRLTHFHRWLHHQKLELSDFRPSHIEEFVRKPFRYRIKLQTQKAYRRWLFRYLSWLYEKQLLSFNPEHCRSHPKHLPASARDFLQELAVTLKPGTVNAYCTALRNFHNFIDRNDIALQELDRAQLHQWLCEMANKNLHPSTRRHLIINVRTYLWRLYDRQLLLAHPQALICSNDLPKLPEYLPRPLTPDTDCALQDLLSRSNSICAKGLLLMRKTGIRIGELASLEYDCVRIDLQRNCFLKVPLGKLNNERLVPMTSDTVQLVDEIKQRKPIPRRYLISETVTKATPIRLLTTPLKRASAKLSTTIQSHQLRHTAATELMNAGMTLPSIMRFLGHRDYRMTLRYAKITQETLVREFAQAVHRVGERYNLHLLADNEAPFDAVARLADVSKWLQTHHQHSRKKKAALIRKRLQRIMQELKKHKLQ